MPKLKRICLLFLIGMQIIDLVQSRSRMRHKQLANDIFYGKRRKARAAGPPNIVNHKGLERHALSFKLLSH